MPPMSCRYEILAVLAQFQHPVWYRTMSAHYLVPAALSQVERRVRQLMHGSPLGYRGLGAASRSEAVGIPSTLWGRWLGSSCLSSTFIAGRVMTDAMYAALLARGWHTVMVDVSCLRDVQNFLTADAALSCDQSAGEVGHSINKSWE